MRRITLLTFLLALLVSLALPATALAKGGNYRFDGATAAQQTNVKAALEASAFDWSVVPARITIHIRPDTTTHATGGNIWLDSRLVDSARFAWAPIQDEYAHQVDFFLFNATTRTRLLGELGGKDWCYGVSGFGHSDYGCERFASTLVWSFWPSKNNSYRPSSQTDESAAMRPARFRALITGLLAMKNPIIASSIH